MSDLRFNREKLKEEKQYIKIMQVLMQDFVFIVDRFQQEDSEQVKSRDLNYIDFRHTSEKMEP